MKKFRLKIVTPKGIYRDEEVEMLNLRTTSGQIGILADHMPLAAGLAIGDMNYLIEGQKKHFALSGGFVYVNEECTTIIANTIESSEDIDLDRAQKAHDRATKIMTQKQDQIDMLRAQRALQRAVTRIRVKELG
ncbi:F0F1 ATP synthase subunit epsilon [Tannockella kyphosi]|uniref:F0F1 ATP synthase subunit epsilon n=1 Tax=Tannockella kyphosi TaxID=2899121 RepID=UPI0020120A8B|nr:F0F1 ATP synthase subunit epsilon [Tannockella kyphosi]